MCAHPRAARIDTQRLDSGNAVAPTAMMWGNLSWHFWIVVVLGISTTLNSIFQKGLQIKPPLRLFEGGA